MTSALARARKMYQHVKWSFVVMISQSLKCYFRSKQYAFKNPINALFTWYYRNKVYTLWDSMD